MNYQKLVRYLAVLASGLVLVVALVITVIYFFFEYTLLGIVIGMIYPDVAPMLVLLYIVPTLIIIRLLFWNKWKHALIVLGICGFLLVGAYLPYFTYSARLADVELQMISTYQADYLTLGTTSMRPVQFSTWDALFGISIDDSLYSIQTDIVYLDNGQDKLKFDFYKPTWGSGPYPAIITVHGGAWVLGNKGIGNGVNFNKYMASKGYVVFDIQYGLYDIIQAARACMTSSKLHGKLE